MTKNSTMEVHNVLKKTSMNSERTEDGPFD